MRLKQKIRGSQGEKLAKRGIETTAVTQKEQPKYRDIACKANFFSPYFRQAAKIYVATSHSVVRQETIEIFEQRTALYDFFHKRSTDVWKTVTNSACRPLYQETSEKSSLDILEIDLTSKLLRYVPLSSGTLWKVSFWSVWKLRWLPTL